MGRVNEEPPQKRFRSSGAYIMPRGYYSFVEMLNKVVETVQVYKGRMLAVEGPEGENWRQMVQMEKTLKNMAVEHATGHVEGKKPKQIIGCTLPDDADSLEKLKVMVQVDLELLQKYAEPSLEKDRYMKDLKFILKDVAMKAAGERVEWEDIIAEKAFWYTALERRHLRVGDWMPEGEALARFHNMVQRHLKAVQKFVDPSFKKDERVQDLKDILRDAVAKMNVW